MNELASHHHQGTPANLSCPECGGTLWEQSDDQFTHYRCHVGHGFTEKVLLGEQKDALETALWSALRALEENAALTRRMAARIGDREQQPPHAADLRALAREVAAFVVRDTGIGIARENLSKIFEPFWQADQGNTRATGGTGLAVCRRIIDLLDGILEVESTLGGGTTFTACLPLQPESL